ncbi:MAG TPA: RNA methyltransferase, partial [Dehalococcoidia bacterium]
MIVSSRQNERVKAVRALREKKERDQTGAFFAEGEQLLRAALRTGAAFELVVLAPDRLTRSEAALVDALEELKTPLLEVTP